MNNEDFYEVCNKKAKALFSADEKLFINPSSSDFCFDFYEVLCTTIWGDVRSYKFGKPIGHDKPHFLLGGGIMDDYVIAWEPMPEPYKENQ